MHLRHLIVLIIDARNGEGHRSCTAAASSGSNDRPWLETMGKLIGQIKKPKFTYGTLSPRGTGQTRSDASLYDVEGSGRRLSRGTTCQTCLFDEATSA